MRAELNEIEFFKDKEVIVTTRKGYILNPNLDWNIDFVELEKAYNQINDGSELFRRKKSSRRLERFSDYTKVVSMLHQANCTGFYRNKRSLDKCM